MKFANSDTGQALIKITALTVSMLALVKGTQAFYALLQAKSAISIFASAITSLIAGEATLTQVTIGLTSALIANPLFWGAIAVAGIVAIASAVDALTISMEEQIQALQEATDAYKTNQSEIESLKGQLDEVQKKINEVNQLKLQTSNEEDLRNLQAQSNELESQETNLRNQLAYQLAKEESVKRELALQARQTKQRDDFTTYDLEGDASQGEHGRLTQGAGSIDESINSAIATITELKELQSEVNKELQECIDTGDTTSETYQELADSSQAYQDAIDQITSSMQDTLDASNLIIEAGQDQDGAIQSAVDSWYDFIGVSQQVSDIIDETVDNLNNEQEAVEEDGNAWDEHLENLQSIQSAYTTLTAAVEEYNSTGSFTAETLSKLNGLTAEQIAALETHNGVMSVNVDLLQQQFEAEKQEMISKLQLAKQIAIVALEEQYLNQEAEATGSQLETQQTINENTATTYNDIYTAASNAAAGVAKVRAALGEDSDEYKQFLEERKSIMDDYDKMIDDVKNTSLSLASANKSSAKKSSSAHKEAAKETKDAWKEAFEEEQRQLKHQLETDEITEYEYYERLKELNEKYFGEISGNHEKYIKEYQENEEQIYKGMKSVYDKVKDYLREAVENGYEKAISALEKEEKQVLAGIKKQINALKKEKESVIKGIENEIDALKKEKDETLKGIEKEIDGLKKKKEQVEEYWNNQIDAIKRENEVLEQQNQLLEYQQALQQAKAQKVMIMQNGRFQLGENESAVTQAEQNLSNYEDQLSYEQQIQQMEDLRDAEIESIEERIEALEEYKEYTEEYYEERIEALEEYKEYMEEYYDEQIEAMEEYYEQVQEQYEAQIDALQAELDAFKEGYQKAEDLDNARLATEVMAANEEAEVWQARLENLAAAVTEYNRLLALMGEAGATATASFSPTMSSHENSANVAQVDHVIQSRASGDSDFADDEVALVGESPNAELILGSKLNRSVNSGELVHLSRGSGVVNAESTSTLAGILNGLAKPNNSGIGHTTQQNFSFGNITLPNVTDADSFVKTLSTQFNNYAIQYGNNRR